MSARKKVNNFFSDSQFRFLGKVAAIVGGYFILTACQSIALSNPTASQLDQKFRLARMSSQKTAGDSVKAYRSVVSPSLYSHCKWSPSDSQFAVIAQAKCGSVKGGLMAFARFLNEEDAPRMGFHITNNRDHLEYIDLPDNCWL